MSSTPAGAARSTAVAAPHTLATAAGADAYADGGNAIDAAIAAAAVLTVVYPHNVALGSDLIALVRTPDGTTRCVNGSGWAGEAVSAAALRRRWGDRLPVRGADVVTVPGGVRGWESLRDCGARLSWARTLAPARAIAAEGFPVSRSLALQLTHPGNRDLHGTPDFDRVFRPDGRLLGPGDDLRQPELADTLAELAERGPGDFYTGALMERSVAYLRSQGSGLTASDFASYAPEVTDPIGVDFAGLRVSTSPPNSQGFLLLRVLAEIERRGLSEPLGADAGEFARLFREGNLHRDRWLADPRFAPFATSTLVRPGPVPRGDTIGVATADSDGYAVSLVQSVFHAFGSGLIDPRTGILFHNRGTGFSLDHRSPNVVAARKRPAHTLMPVLTTDQTGVRHVLATMGGQGQPQILSQVLLRTLSGTGAEQAVAAPRLVVGPQVDEATADSVVIETDLDPRARAALARSGAALVELSAHDEAMGQTNVVVVDSDATMTAASDPRADGSSRVDSHPVGAPVGRSGARAARAAGR